MFSVYLINFYEILFSDLAILVLNTGKKKKNGIEKLKILE